MADFSLPNEIWCIIFSYLPLAPKKNATATCKLWSRLIRADSKLSRHILISWYNMDTALETLQWNWNNWPALQTLELKYHPLTVSREAIQNAIEKLSLEHCPASLEEVIFNFELTPIQAHQKSYGQSLLKYKPYTDQFFGFGFGYELDSIQKWNKYESYMRSWKMGMISYIVFS